MSVSDIKSGNRPSIDDLLRMMADRGASDLHLKPLREPLLRVDGRLLPLGTEPLERGEIGNMLKDVLQPHQKALLEKNLSVDFGYGVHGLARFRCNVYLQRGTLAAAFRMIPIQIQSLEDLELPEALLDFCSLPIGLVLITGPTGSGKSTTLAALMKYVSQHRPVHIVTIEDPIEFLFVDDKASVSQREVGTDTPSFHEALKNVVRQDPDVIMVGEMRDPETVATVIRAAETGHLVFSTLHTNSAAQTVDRILDNFPANQQPQVRQQLAQLLKGVVSMQLIERRDGSGRVAALEIMRGSPQVEQIIEKGTTAELREVIETSVAHHHMQSMNQSLIALLVNGVISYEEARNRSIDPDDLSLKLRKMFPSLESEGGDVRPSSADFGVIEELREYRRLFEEQDEKVRVQLQEKDELIQELRGLIKVQREEAAQIEGRLQEAMAEATTVRAEHGRVTGESQQRIDKLNERIKELNQRLLVADGK